MANNHPEAQWFNEARFGIFLHWGPYSLREIEASWPLMKHSAQHLPADQYEALAERFNPQQYEPKEWVRIAKEAGAKYVVLTAKHHDGFCMFDTKTTDYCAAKKGPGRDLIAPYIEALHEAGLKVGLYFTTIDWHDPDFATIPIAPYIQSPKPFEYDPLRWFEFHKRFMEQLRELLTNYGRIDMIFFDVPGFGADRWRSSEVKQMLLNLQPHLIINDRLPDVGDYATPEQFIPQIPPEGWWETCMTMNHQWAYHSDPSTYKSARTLLTYLSEISGKGGNLLLNVGPKPDGTLPEEAITRLQEIGDWMKHSGEAIYGTVQPPVHYPPCFYGPVTCKLNTVYLHVPDIPREAVELRGVIGEVEQVRLLRTGEALRYEVSKAPNFWKHADQRTRVELSAGQCDPYITVIAIDFKDRPEWPGLNYKGQKAWGVV